MNNCEPKEMQIRVRYEYYVASIHVNLAYPPPVKKTINIIEQYQNNKWIEIMRIHS